MNAPPLTRRSLAAALLLGLALAASSQAQAPATAKATFAGGCFWSVELAFDKLDGVISTTSGYTGGTVPNPSYEQVSSEGTGHAEAVQVVYDPRKLSYERLLEYYWHNIDPTVKDGQFCDRGSSYRTAIYAQDAQQLAAAQASRAALEKTKPFKGDIVTEVRLAGPFYPAEAYHQDFYKTNPVHYAAYRAACGRAERLKQLWGDLAGH